MNSKKTWDSYGRSIYDFFAFVLSNRLDWKVRPPVGLPSAIEAYRDWSKGTLGLNSSTVNQRLRLIARFYEWARKQGHIAEIPFDSVSVQSARHPRFLVHIDATSGKVDSPQVLLRTKGRVIRFLTKEQIQHCLACLPNTTHNFMFQLMVRTGLRQMECRTFPEKYLFNPAGRPDLVPGQKIRIFLNPRDMKLKNEKPREIDMPYDLMEDLYWYAIRRRQKREDNQTDGKKYGALFLTESGQPYGEQR